MRLAMRQNLQTGDKASQCRYSGAEYWRVVIMADCDAGRVESYMIPERPVRATQMINTVLQDWNEIKSQNKNIRHATLSLYHLTRQEYSQMMNEEITRILSIVE